MKTTTCLILAAAILLSGCATLGYQSKSNGNITRLTIVYQRFIYAVRQEGGYALATFRINVPLNEENRELRFSVAGYPARIFHLENTTQENWTLYNYVRLGAHKVHVELWHEDGRLFDWDGLLWVK